MYHANCFDGFGAAWAAWKALGDRATYIPVKHGNPPPELPADAKVFILDFAYPKNVLLDLQQRVAGLTLLDHHKTAQEDLCGLDFVIFDMHKSGAMLAWEYWHPGTTIPDLVAYISDRDLWQFVLPQSREVFAAICSYPMDFQIWDNFDINTLKQEGAVIMRLQTQLVSSMCDQVIFKEIAGYRVPVANASTFFSDVPHELCLRYPDAPFAAYYFDRGDGKRQWGLRSIGEFDVSAVAKQFGGGGHLNAAGFTEG